MQEIYRIIETCDNVVIASPIYFSELTGKMLDVFSRLQMYFSARYFLRKTPEIKEKKGAVILSGGGTGDPQKAYETAVRLLHSRNTAKIHPLICSHNTDIVPVSEDKSVIAEIKSAADFLNAK